MHPASSSFQQLWSTSSQDALGDDHATTTTTTVGPIHHIAIKTRNITVAIQFYSLLGFHPTVKFKAGPAKAAWLEQKQQSQSMASVRIELIEVPSYVLNESEGMRKRAIDFMQRQDLLGHNHIALDVTNSIDKNSNCLNLADYLDCLNKLSLEIFGKTLRIALQPQQQMIGRSVYELCFLYDADGSLLELIRKQGDDLPQAIDSGWDPVLDDDDEGFVV
jgi:catechol 2,3-dioxygenase-like lactoylglutathione lyase family enzyme